MLTEEEKRMVEWMGNDATHWINNMINGEDADSDRPSKVVAMCEIIDRLSARVTELEGALEEIVETCGVVNFSSFNQVKEAVGISLDIAQDALTKEVKL